MATNQTPLPSLLPPHIIHALTARYVGVGDFLSRNLPMLREDLLQAQLEVPLREYAGNAFFAALGNAVGLAFLIALIGTLAKASYLLPFLLVPPAIFIASFFTVVAYPKIIARQRARKLDTYVIPATRQLLIQMRSGVPLFNAISSLSSDYGELSGEFRKVVNRINSGTSEIEALTEVARANPSLRFRRVAWQMTNALKVGGDVSVALQALLDELMREKLDEMRRYGQELSPWIMIYMLAGIILPSLGITLIIVILSFLSVDIPKLLLGILFAGIVGFNLLFLDFVASRRPAI